MRERFIARAIKEGVPLTSPSVAGLGNLGVASALFIVLLVTAAAIRTGPFSRPVIDTGHFDAVQLTKSVHTANPTPADSTKSPPEEKRSEPRQVKERSGSVAPRSIASVTRPSGNFPKPLFPRGIALAAFPVGGNAGGGRPAVVLAVHAVEVQVGSPPRNQPDDHSIGVHFCDARCTGLSSCSRCKF